MRRNDDGTYHVDLRFDYNNSTCEGYVWVHDPEGATVETMTTYRVVGVPGSHEWAYPNTDLGSLDGLLRLNIPGYAALTNTLIVVMPVYQVSR